MTNNFRDASPKRTCAHTYVNYQKYKEALRKDFNARCGYTDCPDFWFGGKNNFHIDHFIPWKKHPSKPELKTDYTNLVYACSYVNILKSNDEGSYLDPCNTDYNEYFSRSPDGSIVPSYKSTEAVFMHKRLKLYLSRYRIIWMLDKIKIKLTQVQVLIDSGVLADTQKGNALGIHYDLAKAFVEYMEYLGVEQ